MQRRLQREAQQKEVAEMAEHRKVPPEEPGEPTARTPDREGTRVHQTGGPFPGDEMPTFRAATGNGFANTAAGGGRAETMDTTDDAGFTGESVTNDVVEDDGGTASVVLGAAAGTIAGAFLGPVGAIVGAIAGGALASTVAGTADGDAADVTDLDQPDRR
jgi:hypothetical protein